MEESETALLSIGTGGSAMLCTDDGHRKYTVRFDPMISPCVRASVLYFKSDGYQDMERQRISNGGEGKRPQRLHKSYAEAKAACEVHAATGQFPPSRKPQLRQEREQHGTI